MLYVPAPEAPTRLSQQLSQLARGSALIDGRLDVNEDDYRLVKRVAFDCIPTLRRRILEAVPTKRGTSGIVSPATLSYCKEDLQALELLREGREVQFSDLSLELLRSSGVWDDFTRYPSPSIAIQ